MAQTAGRNLPPPQSPFVDGKGKDATFNLSNDGYQFLLSLLQAAAGSIATSSVDTNLTATGANQATALQLSSQWNEIVTTPVGSGVLLEALQPGQSQTVFNQGLNALNVYPPPGSKIDALAINIPIALGTGQRHTYDFLSSGQIRS